MNKTKNNGLFSINWVPIVLGALGFWLSASLTLDALVMPSLAGSGMMSRSEFAGVGYGLFGMFNRLELVCAALVLSGILALAYRRPESVAAPQMERASQQDLLLAGLLVLMAAASTYILTPQMGAMGTGVDWLAAVPSQVTMVAMHATYWALELCKFALGVVLFARCYSCGHFAWDKSHL